MADTVNEIGEIVKKCKILLLDIEGTTTSITFVKDKLFPYAEEHVKQFLTEKWENDDVKEAVAALRLLASKDQEASVDGVVSIPGEDTSKDEQIEALVNSVKWQMSLDRKSTALKHLQGLIWKQGYDNGDIKGHVYDDVPTALENWHSVDGRKVYIYSSGSVQAQQLLFGQSSAGDLRASIDGHFDTAVGAKQEASSYIAIAEKIGCKPEDILFLTDIEKEAEAARAAGLHTALVSREGNAPLADSAAAYPLIRSLAQLVVTNKRKQDIETQEENPAKVAKTITQDDTKVTSSEEQTEKQTTAKTGDAPESMEVETEPAAVQDPSKEKEADTKTEKMQVETVVEEIINPDDEIDVPVSEVEPIVIEGQIEKPVTVCEKVGTEEVAVASDEVEITDERPKKETKVTKPLVLMEIEEIAPDKPIVDEVAEIIEDLEPVVEEPDLEKAGVDDSDLDNLKNVGQVLEKECDEILSKVHDVTNLDNITIKPMLNTITEENTENDIADSDDIVDKILDTELEFEMKQIHANGDDKASKVESSKNEVASSVAHVEPSAVDVKAVADSESSASDAQRSQTEVESSTTDVETSVTNVKPASAVDVKRSADVEPSVADSEPAVADVGDGVTPADGDEKSPHEQSESVSEEKMTVTNNEEANATNGVVAPASLNGDDLSSRLAMENGAQSTDSAVNGADSTEVSLNGAGDGPDVSVADAGQPDPATADIKVKAVPAEETHTDQTTEA